VTRRWVHGTLAAALLCTGLMAGLFLAFTVAVLPGLRDADDRTFVTAMQSINAAIQNGLFGLVFSGALIFSALGAVLLHATGRRRAAVWAAAATVLYIIVLVLTMGVEVPLNDRLAHAGNPAHLHDPAGVRERFESTWVPVNNLRTLLNTLAFGCLIPALWQPSRERTRATPAVTVAAWTP
jgi:uncharacterized membrane protein